MDRLAVIVGPIFAASAKLTTWRLMSNEVYTSRMARTCKFLDDMKDTSSTSIPRIKTFQRWQHQDDALEGLRASWTSCSRDKHCRRRPCLFSMIKYVFHRKLVFSER